MMLSFSDRARIESSPIHFLAKSRSRLGRRIERSAICSMLASDTFWAMSIVGT